MIGVISGTYLQGTCIVHQDCKHLNTLKVKVVQYYFYLLSDEKTFTCPVSDIHETFNTLESNDLLGDHVCDCIADI